MQCAVCKHDIPDKQIKESIQCRNCGTWYRSNLDTASTISSLAALLTSILYYIFVIGTYKFDSSEYWIHRIFLWPVLITTYVVVYFNLYKVWRVEGSGNTARKVPINVKQNEKRPALLIVIDTLIITAFIAYISNKAFSYLRSVNITPPDTPWLDNRIFHFLYSHYYLAIVIAVLLYVGLKWHSIRQTIEEYSGIQNYLIYSARMLIILLVVGVVTIGSFSALLYFTNGTNIALIG